MKNIPIRQIKNSQAASTAAGGFSIREVSELLQGKDLFHAFHRHDYYFVLALKNGVGTHEIDFVPYRVGDNSLFVLRPGQVHQLVLQAGSTGYLLQFNLDFYNPSDQMARQFLRASTQKNFCQLEAQRAGRLFVVLDNLFREYSERQLAYQAAIQANLHLLFIEIVRHRQQAATHSDQQAHYAQQRMDELSELLESHLSKHKQVSDYAGMMNMSAYQLNAITKQVLGKTCSSLINEYVVLEAKRQLLATTNQVSQIADQLGYEDISYFIRFFKKHTGHSPEAFRKQPR
jgi:AraC-like DNA-binding protein